MSDDNIWTNYVIPNPNGPQSPYHLNTHPSVRKRIRLERNSFGRNAAITLARAHPVTRTTKPSAALLALYKTQSLAWVNAQRSTHTRPPLDSLLKGDIADASGCPLARSLHCALVHEREWYDGDMTRTLELPLCAQNFIENFDLAYYPELIRPE